MLAVAGILTRLVILSGAVVWIGEYFFKIPYLKGSLPNAALYGIFLGTALWITIAGSERPLLRGVRTLCLVTSAILGMLSGAPAPAVACFVLLSLGSFPLGVDTRNRWFGQALLIAAMFIGWLALILHALYAMLPATRSYAGMEIYSALTIVALSISAMLARDDSGLIAVFT